MDLMLDLETFGTDSNSVIVSISAVVFNRTTGEEINRFESGLNIQEQIDNGAVMDGDTVMWWLTQSKEAQTQLTALPPIATKVVLDMFTTFCAENGVTAMWGNGATFDNVILRNLYERTHFDFPTLFWTDRDVRTLVDLADIDPYSYEFVGTKHNGIDDCLHQIKYCTDAMKKLGV